MDRTTSAPARRLAALLLFAAQTQTRAAAIAERLQAGETRRAELLDRVRRDGRLTADEIAWLERRGAELDRQMVLEDRAAELRRAAGELAHLPTWEQRAADQAEAGQHDSAHTLRLRAARVLSQADALLALASADEATAGRIVALAAAPLDSPQVYEALDQALLAALAALDQQIRAHEDELAACEPRHQVLMRKVCDEAELTADDLTWWARRKALVAALLALRGRDSALGWARCELEESLDWQENPLHSPAERAAAPVRVPLLRWRVAVLAAQELDPRDWLAWLERLAGLAAPAPAEVGR